MSELRTNRIVPRDGLPSGSSGGILQIKQTVITAAQTISTTQSWQDPTGFNITVTPTRSDSKILVTCNINYSTGGNGCGHVVGLTREISGGATSTFIVKGSGGSTADGWFSLNNNFAQNNSEYLMINATGQYLDSPATTSAVTYKVQLYIANGAGAVNINKSNGNYFTGTSSILVMEVTG